jgi:pyruvate formate lyase activating enzyme
MDISKIERSVALLKNGTIPYEFRTTTMDELHSEEDFLEIGKLLEGAKKFFIQSFKDSGDILCGTFTPPNDAKIAKFKDILTNFVGEVGCR